MKSEPTCSNTISVPSGDQLPSSSEKPHEVIRRSPLPLTFTTNKAWFLPGEPFGSVRTKTICLPFGE